MKATLTFKNKSSGSQVSTQVFEGIVTAWYCQIRRTVDDVPSQKCIFVGTAVKWISHLQFKKGLSLTDGVMLASRLINEK
ncbi:hypothetical protein [Secundilactobacillus kimchicus]|uniref:hypothetical protein n=1 Tax=Secundilactobacillus kimchicus TaxID=528209 RepID=UPI0024A9EFA6|nr:hypothetical protein [Secundilactobacillus kimchicus]